MGIFSKIDQKPKIFSKLDQFPKTTSCLAAYISLRLYAFFRSRYRAKKAPLVFVSSSLQLLPLYSPCPCTSSSCLTAPILLSPSSLSFCIEIYTDCVSLTRQHQQYFHTADTECRNKNNYTKQSIIIITVITFPSSF
jgi:hypothetical protein